MRSDGFYLIASVTKLQRETPVLKKIGISRSFKSNLERNQKLIILEKSNNRIVKRAKLLIVQRIFDLGCFFLDPLYQLFHPVIRQRRKVQLVYLPVNVCFSSLFADFNLVHLPQKFRPEGLNRPGFLEQGRCWNTGRLPSGVP